MTKKNEEKIIISAIKDINEKGYTKIENIIEISIIKKIIRYLNNFEKPFKSNTKKEFKNATVFHGDSKVINNLHSLDIMFWDLISHPLITKICEEILSKYSYKDSEGFILIGSAIRILSNKQESQQLHIDSNLPGNNHILSLQFCIPLDPFDNNNGATQILQGSTEIKEYPPIMSNLNKKQKEKLLILNANPGDLLIFNTSLWHGSSKKSTNKRRAAIFMNFGRWFLKPSFDIPNNIPNNIYSKLNNYQKKIAGCYFQPPFDDNECRGRKSKNPIVRKYIEE